MEKVLLLDAVAIRAFEPSDAEGLARILEMPGVFAGVLELPLRSLERRTVALQNFDPTLNIVAVLEDSVVGHASLDVDAALNFRHSGRLDIVVSDDYVCMGIGSRLLESIVHHAFHDLCLNRIELTVLSTNERAINLYTKFGFEREGVLRNYVYKAGSYVDVVAMSYIR